MNKVKALQILLLKEKLQKLTGHNITLAKKNKLKYSKDLPGLTEEKLQVIKDFILFVIERLGIESSVIVNLKPSGETGTTANYDRMTNENNIRFEGRALIDILGSIGHELTHQRQREMGKYKEGETVQNIGGSIENEANSMAGILKKEFAELFGNEIYNL